MANAFNITASTTSVKLDGKGKGEVSVTISNTLGRNIRGRAECKHLGNTGKEWLSIEGAAERNFDPQTAQQFTIKIAVPPGTPEGIYNYRVDAYAVDKPDELFDEGQSIAIEVKKSENGTKPFPMWIIPVIIGVVLIIGGVTAWLLLRDKGPEPPVEPVVVEEEKVEVPNVVSLSFDQAREKLMQQGLEVNNIGTKPTLDFQPGQVMMQNPVAFSSVPKGQKVELTVAGNSVQVPNVKGLDLMAAMQRMSEKKLFVKVTGDQDKLNQKVVGTNPKEDTVVLAESQVTINMPGRPIFVAYPLIMEKVRIINSNQKMLLQKMQRAVEMQDAEQPEGNAKPGDK